LTPEDRELDPEFFLTHQPLTLYRLARARYANLSGIGAAFAPGRWNRVGEEAIYTSTEMGVPVLERLVHTQKDLIPSNLALMKIKVSSDWKIYEDGFIDLKTADHMLFYRSIASAKDDFNGGPLKFGAGLKPFAVAVPSVIVPTWNVVLYPRGAGFWDHVSVESVEAFEFDQRLFPENVSVESREKDLPTWVLNLIRKLKNR
jgi:RES domain-containing protein